MPAASNTSVLYSLFVKMDFRDKKNSGFKRLFGILIAYLFANFILSFSTYSNFDRDSFIVICMSTNAFFLAFVILSDFVSLFLNRGEDEFINSLPVKEERIFFSKFFAAFTFISFYVVAIVLPQLFFYYRYTESVSSSALFVVSVFLFNIFIISLLVILYTFVLRFFSKVSYLFIYSINIIFLLYIFYSTSLRSKAFELGKHSIIEMDFVSYLPQVYFAKALADPGLFAISFSASIAVMLLAFFLIRANLPQLQKNVKDISRKKPSAKKEKINFVDKIAGALILRDNLQRASYFLMKDQLVNSGTLRMRYVIFLLMPVVFALMASFTDFAGGVYFESRKLASLVPDGSVAVLSPSILFIFILCVRLIISNTKIADTNSNDVEWIYGSLPLKNPVPLRLGVLKFIFVNFFVPLLLVMTLILLRKADVTSIVFNLAYVTGGVFFISAVLFRFDRNYPFSLDSSQMDSTGKFLEILITILLGIIIFVIQLFIFKNIIFIVTSIVLLFVIGGLLLKSKRK